MTRLSGIAALATALTIALASTAPVLSAADADPAVQKLFDKLLGAIKTNDRDAFVSDATETVKKGTTKEIMDTLNKHLAGRLNKGFEATYLCRLKQAEHQVHLWKVSFKDGGDDIVFRLALKDGKLGGFFLQ